MKAIVQRRYGGTEQLEFADVEVPTPGSNEVLVSVKAAAVDRGTWHLMTGYPLMMRLAYGFRGPKHPTPGRDFAGVVEAIGAEVSEFEVGDEVIGTADGSFAEFAVAPTSRVTRKPRDADFVEAAALPISGLTALQAVRDCGAVSPGQRVLVIGASGGVGSYAVQIARGFGAEVTGVASTDKLDFVRELGAAEVIDYRREALDARGTGYDVIIDTGGNRTLKELSGLLAETGTLVVVGGETDGPLLGGTDRQLRAVIRSKFVKPKLTALISRETAPDMTVLAEMVDKGQLRAPIDRTFGLADAASAIDYLTSGAVRGKVVVVP